MVNFAVVGCLWCLSKLYFLCEVCKLPDSITYCTLHFTDFLSKSHRTIQGVSNYCIFVSQHLRCTSTSDIPGDSFCVWLETARVPASCSYCVNTTGLKLSQSHQTPYVIWRWSWLHCSLEYFPTRFLWKMAVVWKSSTPRPPSPGTLDGGMWQKTSPLLHALFPPSSPSLFTISQSRTANPKRLWRWDLGFSRHSLHTTL